MRFDIEELNSEHDLKESLNLVKRTFDEFEAPVYSEKGVKEFYKFIDYDYVKYGLNRDKNMLIAKKDEKIIGVVSIKNKSHIDMLFVDKEYHKQGVGSALMKYAIFYCTYNEKKVKITVNSAPYAVEFYKKLDFKTTGDEQILDGIKFTPMELLIN